MKPIFTTITACLFLQLAFAQTDWNFNQATIQTNTTLQPVQITVTDALAENNWFVPYFVVQPADIPVSNTGSFSKTFSGALFTFTPATNNFVNVFSDIAGFAGLYSLDYDNNESNGTETTITAPGFSFDLNSLQYVSDRNPIVNTLSLTITFINGTTDTKTYVLNGNSSIQTLNSFTTTINDVVSIKLVTNDLVYYNNFFFADVKPLPTLPVSLESFTAKSANKNVLLQWQTSAEINTSAFEIQHSQNGLQWDAIGNLMAVGNSTYRSSYSFTDKNPVKGNNFYRLLLKDADGKTSYSFITTVNLLKQATGIIVFPNPVINGSFQIQTEEDCTLQLYNSVGAQVLQQELKVGLQQINVGQLPKGIYNLYAGNNKTRIIIQ